MQLDGSEIERLRKAILSAYPKKSSLKILVREKLEENLEEIVFGENLSEVVSELINWAESKGKIELLIISAYDENRGNPKLKEFYTYIFQQRFILNSSQVPSRPDIGPEIYLPEPLEELQLQGFFKPAPDFLDVGFLKQAIEKTASVCRVEIPSQRIQGTGVLIGQRLVLTNYHVLKPDENADMQANASDTILRFGCFSGNSGNETTGQVFKLDEQQPILHSSPTEKLDYVLLQVESEILNAKDITPARWSTNGLVSKGMGVNLLQHPDGETMKISISHDGITKVYEQRGLIQYVNRTSLGSSGAPCFDENWNLVALHHAQRAQSFGTIREGILFSSIYQQIHSYLN